MHPISTERKEKWRKNGCFLNLLLRLYQNLFRVSLVSFSVSWKHHGGIWEQNSFEKRKWFLFLLKFKPVTYVLQWNVCMF